MPKLRFGTFIGPKAVIITAVVLALMVGTAWAAHRPTPLMDYAPQETAIYDTYYDYLMEDDCRYCHGADVKDRHHYNETALIEGEGGCPKCHPVGPPPEYGVAYYKDCRYAGADVACHLDFSNGWHHNTTLADSDQCTACHNPQILGELTPFQDPSVYPPSVITPTPFSCENCHWEQLADVVNNYIHPSTDIHYDPWGMRVANIPQKPAAGFLTSNDDVQMITGADGYWYSADDRGNARPAGWEKDILDNMATHHMDFQGTVSAKCSNCHANDPGDPSWDPNDPILIRYCERCHDINSLHRIAGHVDSVEIWNGFMYGNNERAWEAAEVSGTADASIYRAFTPHQRCIGCHGDNLAVYEPPYSCGEPSITNLSPNAGEPGAVAIITGANFGEDWTEGCAITLTPEGGGFPTAVPVVYWTDTEVAFRLPAWVFPVGTYEVNVTAWAFDATCTTLSLQTTTQVVIFTVSDHPTLTGIGTSVDPMADCNDGLTYGPFYSTVELCGTGGFGDTSTYPVGTGADPTEQVNVFSQVFLTTTEGSGTGGGPAGALVVADPGTNWNTAAVKNSVTSWTNTAIQFKLLWLWRDDDGDYIQDDPAETAYISPNDIHVGNYAVYVRSIYWMDKNNNGKPDFTADPEDPANEMTQVCVSDPVSLNLTNDPSIWKMKPKRVTKGSAVSIIGANLGNTPPDGMITIYKPDQTTVAATLTTADPRIRVWSETKIRFKTRNMTKGVRWIKVNVGGVDSNLVKFRII